MGKLDGKVALITGAAGGIGSAAARLFVWEGARVIATDLVAPVLETPATAAGGSALCLAHDVTQEDDWVRATSEAVRRFGRIDVLVNNAGKMATGGIQDTSLDGYLDMVMINQVSVYLGMKAVCDAMKVTGGSIVNICSTAALRGTTAAFAYGAAKWAVRGMSKSAALEFAPCGIRVNSVYPGLIDTAMTRPHMDSALASVTAGIPVKRIGIPQDIANILLFLASDENSFVTGSEFVVDGGQTTAR